jgi:tetratricopeptide (TPR) repeat protein
VSAYEVAHLDELDRFRIDEQGLVWRPVRRRLGIRAFGTNAYTAEKAGDRVVEEHREAQNGHEELYFVVSGRATFTLEDEEHDVPAGTFVFCRPGTKRGAVAAEDGTTVFAMGARAGVPHEISGWEGIFVAFGYLRNGDEERGREAIEAVIAERPNEWQGYFNAACFESLTGHKDAAITHLNRAIELNPEAREAARKDEDFDPIRDDPEFPA